MKRLIKLHNLYKELLPYNHLELDIKFKNRTITILEFKSDLILHSYDLKLPAGNIKTKFIFSLEIILNRRIYKNHIVESYIFNDKPLPALIELLSTNSNLDKTWLHETLISTNNETLEYLLNKKSY